MDTLGQALAGIGGLIAFICHIIVIVKCFQNGQTGLGILFALLTCCGPIGILVTLIFGWVKSSAWNIKNLMLVFTVAVVAYLVGFGMAYNTIMAQVEEYQKQMKQ